MLMWKQTFLKDSNTIQNEKYKLENFLIIATIIAILWIYSSATVEKLFADSMGY